MTQDRTWPDGHLFLGQRGPLNERGIRGIIAKLGQAAKLVSPLGPHNLRHTFAKSLLDPAAYELDRQPLPLPAVQHLLGHADIATTTIYTRATANDLAIEERCCFCFSHNFSMLCLAICFLANDPDDCFSHITFLFKVL